jgi:hypothetical protein
MIWKRFEQLPATRKTLSLGMGVRLASIRFARTDCSALSFHLCQSRHISMARNLIGLCGIERASECGTAGLEIAKLRMF